MRVPSPRVLRGSAYVLADHAVASVTNMAATVFVARYLPPADLGRFGVVFAIYWVVLGASRAAIQEQLLLYLPRKPPSERSFYGDEAVGVGLAFGGLAGLLGLVLAALMPTLRPALIPVSVAMPLLVAQDVRRYVSFSNGLGGRALISDCFWLIGLAATLVLPKSLGAITAVWVASGCVSVVLLTSPSSWRGALTRGRPRQWIANHRASAGGLLTEFATVSAVQQAAVWLVAATSSLASAGAYRGGQLLIAPLKLLSSAAAVVAMPAATTQERAALRRMAVAYGVGNALVALLWAALVWVVPDRIGVLVLGESWIPARLVGSLLALAGAMSAVGQSALLVLRATESFRQSLRVRLLSAPMTFTAVATGTALGGAPGAAAGLLVGTSCAVALWVAAARSALQRMGLRTDTQPVDTR